MRRRERSRRLRLDEQGSDRRGGRSHSGLDRGDGGLDLGHAQPVLEFEAQGDDDLVGRELHFQ
ncbi:hypothetical protein [Nannocystis pusilla]|uniref:hypothetical protein n=1 Tax=Nannocystis pusilla TaxID=889268 RepID=UPI003DA4DABB